MAYLAVNRDGEELVFNDYPIYDSRIKENHRYSKSRTGVSMMLMHFQKFL